MDIFHEKVTFQGLSNYFFYFPDSDVFQFSLQLLLKVLRSYLNRAPFFLFDIFSWKKSSPPSSTASPHFECSSASERTVPCSLYLLCCLGVFFRVFFLFFFVFPVALFCCFVLLLCFVTSLRYFVSLLRFVVRFITSLRCFVSLLDFIASFCCFFSLLRFTASFLASFCFFVFD